MNEQERCILKLGDGRLDSASRKFTLIICVAFAVIVGVFYRILVIHAQDEARNPSGSAAKSQPVDRSK